MRISGHKPTYEERKILMKEGLDTYVWLVKKHTSNFIELVHKETGEIKVVKL